ncbi:MAG: hypothetical protein ACOWWH_06945 [Eubacteriaceae bacterium]
MNNRKAIRILILNFSLAVVNIIIFSPGLIGLRLTGGSIFDTALASTILFLDIAIFIYANYLILTKQQKVILSRELKNMEDYESALNAHKNNKTFKKNVHIILDQMDRIEKKKQMFLDLLHQEFNAGEMSFEKFQGVVTNVEKIFYMNIKSIIHKINAFDEDDYNFIKKENAKATFTDQFIKEKLSVYQEYVFFVKEATEDNEEILLKLDKLLLELSKLDCIEENEIDQMEEIKSIDELIKNTKYYK